MQVRQSAACLLQTHLPFKSSCFVRNQIVQEESVPGFLALAGHASQRTTNALIDATPLTYCLRLSLAGPSIRSGCNCDHLLNGQPEASPAPGGSSGAACCQ